MSKSEIGMIGLGMELRLCERRSAFTTWYSIGYWYGQSSQMGKGMHQRLVRRCWILMADFVREFGFGARTEASESEEVEHTTRLFRKVNMSRVLKSVDKPEMASEREGRDQREEIGISELNIMTRTVAEMRHVQEVHWRFIIGIQDHFKWQYCTLRAGGNVEVDVKDLNDVCEVSHVLLRLILPWMDPECHAANEDIFSCRPAPHTGLSPQLPKDRMLATQIQNHKNINPTHTQINISTCPRQHTIPILICMPTTCAHIHNSSSMHPNMAATQADQQHRAYGVRLVLVLHTAHCLMAPSTELRMRTYSSSPKVNTNGHITSMQETLPMTKEPGSSHSPTLSTPDKVHAVHCTTERSSGALGIKTTWRVKISAIGRVWDEYSVQKKLQIMYLTLRKPPNKFGSKAAMNAPRRS
ncbi:hypothetical protein B0H13DRAFT_1907260 [Mycena leptocephala]|nr:hypothetical protein B0H13DRAFT_1907260 [Mycena leptocephala]